MTTTKNKKVKVSEIEDLGDYEDLSHLFEQDGWKLTRFELVKPKNKSITLRLSEELLKEIKSKAKKLGLDYQKFIRITLEGALRK